MINFFNSKFSKFSNLSFVVVFPVFQIYQFIFYVVDFPCFQIFQSCMALHRNQVKEIPGGPAVQPCKNVHIGTPCANGRPDPLFCRIPLGGNDQTCGRRIKTEAKLSPVSRYFCLSDHSKLPGCYTQTLPDPTAGPLAGDPAIVTRPHPLLKSSQIRPSFDSGILLFHS